MPTGTCALCLQTKDLQDSHLMPKAFYKYLRDPGDKNPNPIVVTPSVTMKTSKQVSDYLLCSDCEHRLNVGGEKWILDNCWHSETIFPIHTAVLQSTPMPGSKPSLVVYEAASIPSIDVPKLVHFAASVFWRGGVHHWGPINGHEPGKLELGALEEELRIFLLGSGLPADVVFIVTVNTSPEAGRNEMMLFPWLRNQYGTYNQYAFVVPGITLQMFAGTGVPWGIRILCIERSPQHFIYMSDKMDMLMMGGMAAVLSKSTPKGDLK